MGVTDGEQAQFRRAEKDDEGMALKNLRGATTFPCISVSQKAGANTFLKLAEMDMLS